MAFFKGKRVSDDWYWVLNEVERHTRVPLNSGQRTMAEQEALVREKGVYNAVTNPHGAARPSPTAPHIRVGRQDHALDIDTSNLQRVLAELRKLGIYMVNTVRTEPWHWEAPDAKRLHAVSQALSRTSRRLAKYRAKANALSNTIHKRQKAGKSSPGQRLLLSHYNRMIRKLR